MTADKTVPGKLRQVQTIIVVFLKKSKRFVFHYVDYCKFFAGIIAFCLTQKTPSYAYLSMIRLFCYTHGRFNDFCSWCLGILRPPYPISTPSGVLTVEGNAQLPVVLEALKKDGFYVFPGRLSAQLCDELLRIGLTEKCMVSGEPGREPVFYDRARPDAVKYSIPSTALVNQLTVQKLISDMSLISLAQAYLESRPVLDYVNMWWITNINATPDSDAAQLYHFDMDKLRWLKFFFYVTDVTTENGPHCFIQKSHRSGGIPDSLLRRGYARISDEDASKYYPTSDFMEFTGPRGTIIAEDSRGLHKGKLLEKGDRLVFELEFSNSLFGSVQMRPLLRNIHAPEFGKMLLKYPRLYSHFDIQTHYH
jgi:hypothetical protein